MIHFPIFSIHKNYFMKSQIHLFFTALLMLQACHFESYMPTQAKLKQTCGPAIDSVLQANKDVLPSEISLTAQKNMQSNNGQTSSYQTLVASGYQDNLDNLDTAKANAACLQLAKVILANVENDTSFDRIEIQMQKNQKSFLVEKEWSYSRGFDCNKLREQDAAKSTGQ